MKKLYEIPNNTRIEVSHLGLKIISTGRTVNELNFHHVDGMYSISTDDVGNTIHLRADTEVFVTKRNKQDNVNECEL